MVRRTFCTAVVTGLLCVQAFPAGADFSGRVVAVVSGDCLEVLRAGRRERIRLVEIACPRKGKPWFEAAREFTAQAALDRAVSVVEGQPGRRGEAADVTLPGNRSLTRELLRNGLARCNASRSSDPSLELLEADARAARRGMWKKAIRNSGF
ncbi:MAG: thermonuclease family protein [Deltaproteobacteria bacterium]|nr:thermonuclease family protein [Deltaproteobacteria bacterium]